MAVTGTTGFLGRVLLQKLTDAGATVVPISLREYTTTDALAEVLSVKRCSCLVHLAGPLPTGKEEEQHMIEQTTVELAARCIQAVQAQPACSFILASTVRMYPLDAGAFNFSMTPAPFDGYGRGKLQAEGLAKNIACKTHPVTILRISSICGICTSPEGVAQARGLAPILVRFAKMNRKINVMGSGESTKDLVHVDDCADAFCAAIAAVPGAAQEYFRNVFVGSGVPVTVSQVARLVAEKVEASCPADGPVAVVHVAAAPNDLAGAVDPEPALRELKWSSQRTLDSIVTEAIKRITVDDSQKDRW